MRRGDFFGVREGLGHHWLLGVARHLHSVCVVTDRRLRATIFVSAGRGFRAKSFSKFRVKIQLRTYIFCLNSLLFHELGTPIRIIWPAIATQLSAAQFWRLGKTSIFLLTWAQFWAEFRAVSWRCFSGQRLLDLLFEIQTSLSIVRLMLSPSLVSILAPYYGRSCFLKITIIDAS